jgi:hypothetical protein
MAAHVLSQAAQRSGHEPGEYGPDRAGLDIKLGGAAAGVAENRWNLNGDRHRLARHLYAESEINHVIGHGTGVAKYLTMTFPVYFRGGRGDFRHDVVQGTTFPA